MAHTQSDNFDCSYLSRRVRRRRSETLSRTSGASGCAGCSENEHSTWTPRAPFRFIEGTAGLLYWNMILTVNRLRAIKRISCSKGTSRSDYGTLEKRKKELKMQGRVDMKVQDWIYSELPRTTAETKRLKGRVFQKNNIHTIKVLEMTARWNIEQYRAQKSSNQERIRFLGASSSSECVLLLKNPLVR